MDKLQKRDFKVYCCMKCQTMLKFLLVISALWREYYCYLEGNMQSKTKVNVRNLVLLGILSAIVILLQMLGAVIRFGPFSISLVLIPIVIGAALIGIYAGVWLGIVFGAVVLLSGDASAFLAINPAASVLIVMLRGILAGFTAGLLYKLISSKSRTAAAIVAGAACPIVNTGIFIIGMYIFFLPTIQEWGIAAGFADATAYLFLGMAGFNFLFEFGLNLILSPVIIRLIQYGRRRAVDS